MVRSRLIPLGNRVLLGWSAVHVFSVHAVNGTQLDYNANEL